MSGHAYTLKRALVAVLVHRQHRMHMSISKGKTVQVVRELGDGRAEIEWDGDTFLVSLEELRASIEGAGQSNPK